MLGREDSFSFLFLQALEYLIDLYLVAYIKMRTRFIEKKKRRVLG